MFDKFNAPAKQAVRSAQDEAISLGHDFIGTEHLLLGLTGAGGLAGEVLGEYGVTADNARTETVRILTGQGVQPTGGQEAKDALASIGIDVEEIRRRADEAFGEGEFKFPRPAYTPRAKKMLQYTLREALELKADDIGTEHMLLGMLTEGEGVGVQVLDVLGVDTVALRRAVITKATG
jgi:ATP-dependent Clp protease ATP-binding subunit ClpA